MGVFFLGFSATIVGVGSNAVSRSRGHFRRPAGLLITTEVCHLGVRHLIIVIIVMIPVVPLQVYAVILTGVLFWLIGFSRGGLNGRLHPLHLYTRPQAVVLTSTFSSYFQ